MRSISSLRQQLHVPQAHFVRQKKKDFLLEVLLFLAEQEGFEPSVPFWGTHDFQSCPL